MVYSIFSIKDTLSGQLSKLEIFPNDAMACRWFDDLCCKSSISKDLQLFRLGTYDIDTGFIMSSCEFIKGGVDNVKD